MPFRNSISFCIIYLAPHGISTQAFRVLLLVCRIRSSTAFLIGLYMVSRRLCGSMARVVTGTFQHVSNLIRVSLSPSLYFSESPLALALTASTSLLIFPMSLLTVSMSLLTVDGRSPSPGHSCFAIRHVFTSISSKTSLNQKSSKLLHHCPPASISFPAPLMLNAQPYQNHPRPRIIIAGTSEQR